METLRLLPRVLMKLWLGTVSTTDCSCSAERTTSAPATMTYGNTPTPDIGCVSRRTAQSAHRPPATTRPQYGTRRGIDYCCSADFIMMMRDLLSSTIYGNTRTRVAGRL